MSKMSFEDRQEQTLESIEQRLDELPILPSLVTRIAMMDHGESGFVMQLEALVREDPPLATRLLRAASATGLPIRTIPEALVRVGARRLAQLVTSMSVVRVFVPTTTAQRNLWIHALQVAVGARIYARDRPELAVDPEEAYLAGLLHDIGRFVMLDIDSEEVREVDEIGWTTPKQLVELETKICGFDHAQLGWHACKAWGLPERVSALIRDHHVYEGEQSNAWPLEMQNLVRVVQAADVTSIALLSDPNLRRMKVSDQIQTLTPRWMQFVRSMPLVSAEQLDQIDTESHGLALGLDLIVS